ncbi:TetR/AcrR family transcriptional regulator [Arthrobacter sp. TMN-37]
MGAFRDSTAGARAAGVRVAQRSRADPAHPLIASHEAEVRARVLKAASALVDRLSYDAVTVDAVARASGVSKSTLYRYWPSRQLLVLEAFTYKTNLLTTVEDTGDVGRDLHTYLVSLAYCLKVGGAASTVANLLAEAIHNEEFALQFRQTLLRERRQGFLAILGWGQRRGQVRDDVDLVVVVDAVYGALHHRLIATGQDVDGPFLRALTRFAVDGTATPAYREAFRTHH